MKIPFFSRSTPSNRVPTITEDLTLFRCQQEHARRDREAMARQLRRPGAIVTRQVGYESHVLTPGWTQALVSQPPR